MKKQLLKERFQQLAGLKPLYELSPELKARAAGKAKEQGRDTQADRFGKSKSYGDKADDSAFKDFIGKELGPQDGYMTKLSNIDVEQDGFKAMGTSSESELRNRFGVLILKYKIEGNYESLTAENVDSSSPEIWNKNKDRWFNRQSIGILKQMIKISNPESKLANTHWASFKIEGAGVKK